jgi:hypothetical protein
MFMFADRHPAYQMTALKQPLKSSLEPLMSFRGLPCRRIFAVVVITLFFMAASSMQDSDAYAESSAQVAATGSPLCPLGEAIETHGHRRLALIVGVGQYRNDKVPDLEGPPNDGRRFYELLTGPNGYGFPKENVCLLLDEAATTGRVKEAFEQGLVRRARAGDVAVLFYAGHGSQTKDTNHDEPDEYDETFLFHDARTDDIRDLLDDELHPMLVRLHHKTQHVTVILDSCNSGTATRDDAGTFTARFFDSLDPIQDEAERPAEGDGDPAWVPAALPGLVVFTAATDGTPALETEGRGIFTNALIRVLSEVGAQPLTYAQAARQISPLVSADSYQIPYFQGDLSRPVFGNTERSRPRGWEVVSPGPPLELSGPPLPGMGRHAELRVYDGAVTGADTRDPSKAKALVVIDRITGVNATAHVASTPPAAAPLERGDLAVLVRPSDEALTISLRLRPSGEPGGLPEEAAAAVRTAVQHDKEASILVELTEDAGDFELSQNHEGELVLRGSENRIRHTFEVGDGAEVAENLWQHARQKALLHLQGEGGSDFTDHQTLRVQLVPARQQKPCADGEWKQAEPGAEQIIPLCHAWNVQVTRSEEPSPTLLIGGAILSTDGSMFGLPADGRAVPLKPGETVTFEARLETFIGAPPLDVQDHVLVFGTQESNPVPWHLLTYTAAERRMRARGEPTSALFRALDRYMQPGVRGQRRYAESVVTTWTLSSLTMRVQANPGFLEPQERSGQPAKREYTIPSFDIRPYLPDDSDAALRKVLEVAHWLATAAVKDGIPYEQHAWNAPSDKQNLQEGIDCSRAIWFAFTRAGLPYNDDDEYLYTGRMVGAHSQMAEAFERCDDDPNLQLGDVLVYRDPSRDTGHTVMVIDPAKRIAWGSHGWDGNTRFGLSADTGVEYQKIKYKQDWERWDRQTVVRRACWRHQLFVGQRLSGRSTRGVNALENACNRSQQCGLDVAKKAAARFFE